MTHDEAHAYMLTSAAELAKFGWRVSEISETRCVVSKARKRPRQDSVLTMDVVDSPWGKTVRNARNGRPKHCELCGVGNPDMDTTDQADDFMVVCNQCAIANGLSPKGLYEWGWVDIAGPSGCSGASPQFPLP